MPMTADRIPQLVGHRGDMTQYPENSWPALQAAVDAGACWLEFDVQMSADSKFVLLHDADFQRTGNDPRGVFELNAETCSSISVHHPARFGERFVPAPTPLLDEVLKWLSTYPDVRAMVEIKTESLKHFGRETVMRALLEALTLHRDQCVLISFDGDALQFARRHASLELGWVLHKYNDQYRQRAEQLKPQYLICNHKKIPSHQPPWPGNWRWMLYDIMDPQLALNLAQRGVDLIETGDITRLLKHPQLARRVCPHGL
jgi:glycerophosphoryl diester phosphodiesterase